MQFNIKPEDTVFNMSPDCGPDCLCSRCGKPIYNQALRFWPPDGKSEYRYHFVCQGIKSDTNDFEPEDESTF